MAYVVSSGEVSSGIILNKDSMTVLDGGIAENTTANSGGSMFVSSGGMAETTVINSRGSMFVSEGGTATRTVVSARGSMHVSSGGLADGTMLSSGGIVNVSAGGIARDTTVNLGGRFTVLSGGTASDVALNGRITVSSGGTATGFVVSDGALWDFTVAPDTLIAGTSAGSAFEIRDGLVSGCTNNAASQIIYYWLEKGMLDLTLSLEDSDAYKCTTGVTIDSSDAPLPGIFRLRKRTAC